LQEIIAIDLEAGNNGTDVEITTSICAEDEAHIFTGELAGQLREFLQQQAGLESWETGPDVDVGED